MNPPDPNDNQDARLDLGPYEPAPAPANEGDQEQMTVLPSTAPPPPSRSGVTEDGRFKSGRLAGLTLGPALWVLSWPVITESFLNSLVGLVDTGLAAGLPDGEAATDAIGGASYIMWFIGLVIMALGVGATALVARSVGKGRLAVARTVIGQTATLSIITGVLVGAGIWAVTPHVAAFLNMSEGAGAYFATYMRIIAFGVPFSSMLFGLIACARGAGDSVSPLWAMVVRNVVNIAVSWTVSGATVFGQAPPLSMEMGVAGIAIGTVAGDVAGMLVILAQARSGRWSVRLRLRRMRPHWITTRRIVRLGLPNFAETLGMWLGNALIVGMVGLIAAQRGTQGMLGAHIIAIRIEAFSFLPGFAMGAAAATLAGQYLGARRPDLARRAVLTCTAIASAMMAVIGLAFILFSKTITGWFSPQPTHLAQVPILLVICGAVQIPFAISIVTRSGMRGAGDVRGVMVVTWITTYAIRLPFAYVCSGVDLPVPAVFGGGVIENPVPWEPTLTGLWIGLCSELVLRGVLFALYFLKGRWLEAKV